MQMPHTPQPSSTALRPVSFWAIVGTFFALIAFASPSAASSYTIVPGGAPVRATTVASGENATLTFNGTAGKRISLKMTSVTIGTSGCCSTKVSILRPGGTVLVAPVSVGRRGGFIDTRTLPVTGVYKILVDPQGTARGSMTLTLYDVPADASASIAPNGIPVTTSAGTPGQNARLSFTGTAAQRVSMNLSSVTIGSSACCSTRVSILKPDGTAVAPPVAVGRVGRFIEPQTLPVTGTYTILIDPQSAATGSATVALYDVPPDATTTLAPGVGASLTTTGPGQNFAPTFNGTLGQRVSLAVSDVLVGASSCCNLKVSIAKPDGTPLFAPVTMGSAGGLIEAKTLPATGLYKVLVDPMQTDTGSLKLTLYNVPPDTSAPISANGSPLTVTTTAPGQNARATFSGTAGQRVSLVVRNVAIGSSTCCDVKISLLKPDGTALATMLVGTNGGFLDTKSLPTAGGYTIYIDPQGAATGSLDLLLYTVPADKTGALILGGTPLSLGTTAPGQNLRATFSAVAGQRVSVTLSDVTLGSSECCGNKVSILKPNGTLLFSPAVSMGTRGVFIEPKTIPTSGTYTVLVNPLDGSVGSVTLRGWSVPADVNSSIALNGSPVTLAMNTPGQNARLTFAGTAGRRVALVVTAATIGASDCCGATVAIRKPDGTFLAPNESFGTEGEFVEPRTLPVTGTYTIVLDPYEANTGSATLKLYDVPADTQAPIAVGGSVAVTISTPGQSARLTFSGPASQRVTVTLSNVTIGSSTCCGMQVSIFEPDGSRLSSAILGTTGGSLSALLPMSGSYTIVIDPIGAATGGATVALA